MFVFQDEDREDYVNLRTTMKVKVVETTTEKKEFLELPVRIYQGIPQWVRPQDNDVNLVFDTEQNLFFTHGKLQRWLLWDDSGKVIGRVAAFINEKTAHTFDQPTGGMGFFECINDQKAANLLFDTCKKWLQENGMEAMDGPINFGENDRFWGCVVEGFEEPPLYCHNYNPPYYKSLFENYGFRSYFNQLYYRLIFAETNVERYKRLADRAAERYKLHTEGLNLKNKKKYAKDFCEVYNKAWVTHDNFKPMTESRALTLLNKMAPVMDTDIMIFAYAEGKPVGLFLCLPELNTVFKKIGKGHLNFFNKLRFLWLLKRGGTRRVFGFVFGVVPEYQKKGVESIMVMHLSKVTQVNNPKYDWFDFAWIGDFNPGMISLVESFGVKKIKTSTTYRKLFDETKPFQRSPIIHQK